MNELIKSTFALLSAWRDMPELAASDIIAIFCNNDKNI